MNIGDMFISSIAVLITLPMIATLFLYIISKEFVNHKWRAIHIAVNWTTILYLISTLILFKIIFEQQFFGIIAGLLILILGFIIIMQWKMRADIALGKAIKILWRFCFLLFSFLYVVLVVFGIMQKILYH